MSENGEGLVTIPSKAMDRSMSVFQVAALCTGIAMLAFSIAGFTVLAGWFCYSKFKWPGLTLYLAACAFVLLKGTFLPVMMMTMVFSIPLIIFLFVTKRYVPTQYKKGFWA